MLGAVALGSAIGYVGGRVLNKWQGDDHVNFTFSIALAIGGYIIGDHVSPCFRRSYNRFYCFTIDKDK